MRRRAWQPRRPATACARSVGSSPSGGAASPPAPAGSCRPRGSPLCTSLRVGRLAAGEHLYEALDATRACVGALGLADAQQHRVAVLACEDVEHRPRGRIGAQRGGQVGGDVDARLARIGLLYPAVLFGALEDGQAGGQHPPFLQQTLDLGNVVLRPRPAGAPWGEALPEGELIEAADLSVDPAVAERLLECLAVGEAGRLGGALLGQSQPNPRRALVVLAPPRAPGACVDDEQLGNGLV